MPRRGDFGLNERAFQEAFCATCPEPFYRLAFLACDLDPDARCHFTQTRRRTYTRIYIYTYTHTFAYICVHTHSSHTLQTLFFSLTSLSRRPPFEVMELWLGALVAQLARGEAPRALLADIEQFARGDAPRRPDEVCMNIFNRLRNKKEVLNLTVFVVLPRNFNGATLMSLFFLILLLVGYSV